MEAGLIVLPMFAVLFLLFDICLVLFTRTTLQQAVRDGVRFGVTGQTLTGDTYLNDSIVRVVQNSAMGLLGGASGACKIYINYYDASGAPATMATGGNVLEVGIQGYNYTPLAPLLKSRNPITLSLAASDVIETCPLGGCPQAVNPRPPTCP